MKRLLSTTLVLALAGCALMEPAPKPVATLTPAQLGLNDAQTAWPATQWWQGYGDPQLNRLVDLALANSPSLTAAQARLAQANAAVAGARAPLMPRVDANYSLSREHLSGNYIYPAPLGGSVASNNRLALDFSYELDFWGKNRSRLKAAVSQRDAAQADTQAARNLLARSVARAYLNLQNAFAQQAVIQRIIAQREQVQKLTQSRKQAGLDTEVEVKQAESATAAARVDLTQVETTLAQLRNQLAALTASSPAQMQALTPVRLSSASGVLPKSLPLELLGHRPDVVAARWRAEAARQQIESAKAEFYPNVNIVAFAGVQALGTNMLLDSFSRTAGIGPAISLPIFHGGELNANLAGRRADADLAVSDYNQTVLGAVQQVADAIDALRLIDREKTERKQAHEAIEAAYELALKRYRNGLGNYLSVLIAQDGVLAQARLQTDLQYRAYQLDADLAYALGGGYTASTAQTTDQPSNNH
ncbi:efflux transporter outer membrane subunit [Bordetella avium]|uniref:Outer membrane multidrug efflux protein n=1 Tax=Bordetella avium (strain 197N) TaxID=360910 RepID=Q2KYZ2_BORA1|nr:efflux transporter outer membrane subunit [Bordetella avium]RIQ48116.1 efflux transporter outer membrane subunit [Bordetella avium]RIQ67875.1 efflux transporter outer membrane subunit [Bordetella avium]CAJ49799.1 outer membrane multidrug efflux protein [Bordetella avium 197N]